jgi:hypothetical protein
MPGRSGQNQGKNDAARRSSVLASVHLDITADLSRRQALDVVAVVPLDRPVHHEGTKFTKHSLYEPRFVAFVIFVTS